MKVEINVPDNLSQDRLRQEIQEFEQRLKMVSNLDSINKNEKEKALDELSNNPSCYDLARELGVIGCAVDLPPDLSTNKVYLEGFGE